MTSPHQRYERDPRVDDYIAQLPKWQQKICQQLRDLIHAADPEVTETIKRTVRPYFILQGNVCALLAAKNHVNLFLYDGAIVADPEKIITAGHDNKYSQDGLVPTRSNDQPQSPDRDAQTDHRRQPGRRLAQAQAAVTKSGLIRSTPSPQRRVEAKTSVFIGRAGPIRQSEVHPLI